jgi:hypothetical protein
MPTDSGRRVHRSHDLHALDADPAIHSKTRQQNEQLRTFGASNGICEAGIDKSKCQRGWERRARTDGCRSHARHCAVRSRQQPGEGTVQVRTTARPGSGLRGSSAELNRSQSTKTHHSRCWSQKPWYVSSCCRNAISWIVSYWSGLRGETRNRTHCEHRGVKSRIPPKLATRRHKRQRPQIGTLRGDITPHSKARSSEQRGAQPQTTHNRSSALLTPHIPRQVEVLEKQNQTVSLLRAVHTPFARREHRALGKCKRVRSRFCESGNRSRRCKPTDHGNCGGSERFLTDSDSFCMTCEALVCAHKQIAQERKHTRK